eukprot:scaffold3947_cov222-Chaetoceros_neogracile.AAC.6
MSTEIDQGKDYEFKKYKTYALKIDPNQDDKATEIRLCNFSRPHMRAFHCSWWTFFVAFFIWFAIAPLLSEVKISLDISKQDIWTSNICSVAGTIVMRFVLGPLCDKYGARTLMGLVLMGASIPCALIGLVNSAASLAITRFFIGLGGSTFVMCQYWSTSMFSKEIVGTANALVGGWGNLGGGVTQLVMGSVLFPLFKQGMSAEMAWRTVSIVPAVVGFATGFIITRISDDCPKGNFKEMKEHGIMTEVSASASFRDGAMNLNTWLLFIQYGCCFGVELTMNNASASYFKEVFELTTESASAIASIFGWMNLFARGLGGFTSDKLNSRMGLRGRLIAQICFLTVEAIMAAEGSTYGIVPYVDPAATGSISGIVGAGGNSGAVAFGLCFRQLDKISTAFNIMGHRGLLGGEDSVVNKAAWQKTGSATLSVPVEKAFEDDKA